jgi:hypothetical protein
MMILSLLFSGTQVLHDLITKSVDKLVDKLPQSPDSCLITDSWSSTPNNCAASIELSKCLKLIEKTMMTQARNPMLYPDRHSQSANPCDASPL